MMSELDLSSMSSLPKVNGAVERPTEKTEAGAATEKSVGEKGKSTEVVSKEGRAEEIAGGPKAPDEKVTDGSSRVEDSTEGPFRVESDQASTEMIHESTSVEEKAQAIHEPPPPIKAIAALFVGREVPRFGCILDSSEFAAGVPTWLQMRGDVETDIAPEAAEGDSTGIDFLFAP